MHAEANPEDIKTVIWGVTIVFLGLAVFIVFFLFLFNHRKNKLIKDKLFMQAQFDHSLLQTQLEIREQTLRTISQEIHDNVGQVLSLAKLNLSTLGFSQGEQREEKISSAAQLVGKAINDLRDLSRSINGDKIADLGLRDAIDNELKIIQNTGQFLTHFTVNGDPFKLLPQHEIVVFRIVQESLNNTIKHSKAQNIHVNITYTTDTFGLVISDDGKGFDASGLEASQTGIGLHNMKERATLIGARFSIQATPGEGTSVFLTLHTQPE